MSNPSLPTLEMRPFQLANMQKNKQFQHFENISEGIAPRLLYWGGATPRNSCASHLPCLTWDLRSLHRQEAEEKTSCILDIFRPCCHLFIENRCITQQLRRKLSYAHNFSMI